MDVDRFVVISHGDDCDLIPLSHGVFGNLELLDIAREQTVAAPVGRVFKNLLYG